MKKVNPKYDLIDLKENSKAYQENFKDLVRTADWSDERREKYVLLERKLNFKDVKIRKSLGIFIPDPCPLTNSISCNDCSGIYINEEYITKKGRIKVKTVQTNKFNQDGIVCKLKKVITPELLEGEK